MLLIQLVEQAADCQVPISRVASQFLIHHIGSGSGGCGRLGWVASPLMHVSALRLFADMGRFGAAAVNSAVRAGEHCGHSTNYARLFDEREFVRPVVSATAVWAVFDSHGFFSAARWMALSTNALAFLRSQYLSGPGASRFLSQSTNSPLVNGSSRQFFGGETRR